ncbi:PDZ domain-containing protein [Streptomyces sp. V2]|uniref:S41 family peptidase n=1 Tax=Streptomyces TaxID=1883 RepID=UPI0006EB2A0A|nr:MULTISPECIES: S41 family peptidase [Streptomyces]PWG10968.1 PDZ domain-containing protein [Streptomyces sp. V2]
MSGPDLFSQPRRFGRGAALTLVFASVLVAGAATGSLPQGSEETGAARSVVPDARRQVAQAAADAMAAGKSPTEAAERAVSRSGDRWAAVYSQGEYEEFEQSLDGEYTGVGLWARRESDGAIAVSKVSGGSPAQAAGIRAGDRLTSVDGRAVDGLPVTDVLSLLRGDATDAPAGTAVRLGLSRGARAWDETVRRATLSTEPVTVRKIAGGGTLVRVSAFTKGVGEAVRAAVREVSGGVVLDLRGNSGGLVTEAVGVASVFLDGGLVATYDTDGTEHALHADAGGDTTRPLVALVDGGTMSAAELLTGALQDRGRAVVVGSRTFGKGSVQMPTRLPDGSVAELTVGHYRTPSGHAVDGVGIAPDLEVEAGVLERAERVLSGSGRTP